MPYKSWAFDYNGHICRTEIWWRFTGRNRKRLYVDHQRVIAKQGRFTFMRPLSVEIHTSGESTQPLLLRFRPRKFFFDMECEIKKGAEPFKPLLFTSVDRSWRANHEVENQSRLAEQLGCLMIFPVLILLVILSGPLALIGVVLQQWHERQLRRKMRKAGRYLSWPEIEDRLRHKNSPGTLIQQVGNLERCRVWYTDDDIVTGSPLPLPAQSDLMHPSAAHVTHPFNEWCDYAYLEGNDGKAFLTDVPASLFEQIDVLDEENILDGENHVARLHGKYPLLNLVSTAYTGGKRKKAEGEFVKIIGDDPREALPRLLVGAAEGNPALRRMCLQTIRLSGESAASAVPKLKELLYRGSGGDSYLITEALAGLGQSGEDVLKQASKLGDPKIARPARSSLRLLEESAKRDDERPIIKRAPMTHEAGERQRKQLRRSNIMVVAGLVLTLILISASGWFLGPMLTIGIFIALAISAVAILIWVHIRGTQKRINAHRSATPPASQLGNTASLEEPPTRN